MIFKKIYEKHRLLVLLLISSCLTALVLCTVYLVYGLFPFGAQTLAWGDMKQQVIPLLLDFKDILTGKADMFLNLQNAGGMSFWGVFFFFLSSPFSFLVLLIEKSQIYLLVNILVLLKLVFCSASAAVFFASYKKNNGFFVVVFSVSYAFCGFGLLYYQNALWLDLMCMFPLTMLSIHWLFAGKRIWPFSVCLTATIILCYYLSFMVFLALLLFIGIFCFFCTKDKQEKRRISSAVVICVTAALGAAAAVWLPSFLQYCHSARTQDVLSGLIHSNLLTNLNTSIPILYCTPLLAAIPYLLRHASMTPLRVSLLGLFTLTMIPLFIDPVNKMWHIGSYQAFPARYGYITVFAGLWLAADLLSEKEPPRLRKAPLWRGLCFLFSAACFGCGIWLLAANFDKLTSYTHSLWFNADSTRYLLLFTLISSAAVSVLLPPILKDKPLKKTCAGLFLVLILFQSFVFSSVLIGSSANGANSETLLLENAETLQTNDLFRVKANTDRYSVNLIGAMGFPTLDHYTSLTDDNFYQTTKKLGYSAYWMETSSFGGTAISDLLLSNRYSIEKNGTILPTQAAYNIGIVTKTGALPETFLAKNRLIIQNQLFQAVTGTDGIHFYAPKKEETAETLTFRYSIPVTKKETLYLDAFMRISNQLREKINDSMAVLVNGTEIRHSFPTQKDNGILSLGSFEQETVKVQINFTKKENAKYVSLGGLYQEDYELLSASLRGAASALGDHSVTFSVNAVLGESLFISIPYYKGMQVTVNGAKTPVQPVMNSFFEVPLQEGENEVCLSYLPQGLIAGIFISCATLLFILLLWVIRRSAFFHKIKIAAETVCCPLLAIVCAAAVLCVYIVPVVLSMFSR